MMKEINKNLYKAAISADFLDKFIEKCDDLSIISLFLKDYLSNYSSGYDNYSYTGYSKKTDLLNVVKSLENKIKKAEYDQVLEKMLYTEIYSEMLIAKKNNKNDNTYTKNEHLQDIREKIKIVIAVLIESQIGELLKILENLQEVLKKYK